MAFSATRSLMRQTQSDELDPGISRMRISDICPLEQAVVLQLIEKSFHPSVVPALNFQIWKLRPGRLQQCPELQCCTVYGIVNHECADQPIERSAQAGVATPPVVSACGRPKGEWEKL